jgi:hypothetical protein
VVAPGRRSVWWWSTNSMDRPGFSRWKFSHCGCGKHSGAVVEALLSDLRWQWTILVRLPGGSMSCGVIRIGARRDKSGVEIFRLFYGKIEMEWKYENGNGNGNLRNGNGNGIFLTEMETETEQRVPAKQMRKRKFPFPTNTKFPFYGCFA